MASLSKVPLLDCLSDPSFQPTRLVCLDSQSSVLCNGDKLYTLTLKDNSQDQFISEPDSGNVCRKNNLVLDDLQSLCVTESRYPLQSVQKIRGNVAVASVDSNGYLCLAQLKQSNNGYSFGEKLGWNTNCSDFHYSTGWAGLVEAYNTLVTAKFSSREITWNDIETGRTTHRSLLMSSPTCIASSSSIGMSESIAIVGDHTGGVSVWDGRQGDRGSPCAFFSLSLVKYK
jgi:hypothetical protein